MFVESYGPRDPGTVERVRGSSSARPRPGRPIVPAALTAPVRLSGPELRGHRVVHEVPAQNELGQRRVASAEDHRLCLLVLDVREGGVKELLALDDAACERAIMGRDA